MLLNEFFDREALEKYKSGALGNLYWKIDDKFWESCTPELAEKMLSDNSYITNNIIFLSETYIID